MQKFNFSRDGSSFSISDEEICIKNTSIQINKVLVFSCAENEGSLAVVDSSVRPIFAGIGASGIQEISALWTHTGVGGEL